MTYRWLVIPVVLAATGCSRSNTFMVLDAGAGDGSGGSGGGTTMGTGAGAPGMPGGILVPPTMPMPGMPGAMPGVDAGALRPPPPPPPPEPGAERPTRELPPEPSGAPDGGPVADRPVTMAPPDAAPAPPPAAVLPGGACRDSAQCAGVGTTPGVCVPGSIGFGGGYCAAPGCSVTTQNCPGGAAAQCIPGDDGPVCVATCDPTTARPCRDGYVCLPPGPPLRPICIPGCVDDAGCPGGACWRPAGQPVGRCYDPLAQIGDECVQATDCPASSVCLAEADFGWPHGYCVITGCRTSADCPAWGACTGDGATGSCALRCKADGDCRSGYRCLPGGRAGEAICVPRCTTGSQCRNLTCHIGTGLC